MKKILLTLLILAQLVVVAETKKGKAPVSQPKRQILCLLNSLKFLFIK